MQNPRDVILAPVVSEKSYTALDHNVYTFVVHPDASKTQIKHAIEEIFEVHVVKVNTMLRRGKRKRTRYTWGERASQKRAIVTLAADDKIEIFNPK